MYYHLFRKLNIHEYKSGATKPLKPEHSYTFCLGTKILTRIISIFLSSFIPKKEF